MPSMRFLSALLLLLSAAWVWAQAPSPGSIELGKVVGLGLLAGGAQAWERDVVIDGRTVPVKGVSFSEKEYVFRVIDNPPEARQSLAAALLAHRAVAGSNGGYFHPDFTPLGLEIAGGVQVHAFQKARLLSGLLVERKGGPAFLSSESFKGVEGFREALQTGPWLVHEGLPVKGLNAVRSARRTLVATDGHGHWALVVTGLLTLQDTASFLTQKNALPGWPVSRALNLDGGSSTALAALSGARPLIDVSSFGPVRNYLAIVPR